MHGIIRIHCVNRHAGRVHVKTELTDVLRVFQIHSVNGGAGCFPNTRGINRRVPNTLG